MARIDDVWNARELVNALDRFREAQAEIDAKDWWGGPPFHLEQRRDSAGERVGNAVRAFFGDES